MIHDYEMNSFNSFLNKKNQPDFKVPESYFPNNEYTWINNEQEQKSKKILVPRDVVLHKYSENGGIVSQKEVCYFSAVNEMDISEKEQAKQEKPSKIIHLAVDTLEKGTFLRLLI